MSKMNDMQNFLYETRDWSLQVPSETQVKAFEILKATPYSNIGEDDKLIGLIQGYALIEIAEGLSSVNAGWFLCCKLYKTGSITRQFWASDEEEAMRLILRQMAWGALGRRSNFGVWQRQLPLEISPFRRSYHHPGPNGEIS